MTANTTTDHAPTPPAPPAHNATPAHDSMAYFGGPPAPYPGAYTNPAAYAAAAGYGAMPNMMGGPMPPMMAPAPTNVPPLLPTDEVRWACAAAGARGRC